MKQLFVTSDVHSIIPKIRCKNQKKYDAAIIAGDIFPGRDLSTQYAFYSKVLIPWFKSSLRRTQYIIIVAGNHDILFEKRQIDFPPGVIYLKDNYTILWDDYRTKIWGSPWTLGDGFWAFSVNESEMERRFRPPLDTNIIISHSPPYNIHDKTYRGESIGSKVVRDVSMKVKPSLHIFGHVHEDRGYSEIRTGDNSFGLYLNASLMGENMKPMKPWHINYTHEKVEAIELD